MQETDWSRLKAHELRALAAQDAVVILPIASIEQHGPHLPTMTDTRLGYEVNMRAARKACATRPVVVAPVVWSGLSEHHMPFGGTLTLSHATFRAVLHDLIVSITRHGFRHILISNSHGGNMVAMQQICDELGSQIDAVLVGATYVAEAGEDLAQHCQDQPGVMHGGEAETSMMLACEPDLVDTSDLASVIDGMDGAGFLKAGKTAYRWRPFPHITGNGMAGNASRATAEKGERMLEAGANALAALICDPATWADPADRRGAGTMGGAVPLTQVLTTPQGRRIAYVRTPGTGPGVVFLGGFKSDMTGTKAQFLEHWARDRGRAFLRFDYSGHGQSSGDFLDGCIGDWSQDAMEAIRALTDGPQVLVGSSMGGWIALLVARAMPDRVAALVGIAAAPDFTEDGLWSDFSDDQRARLDADGVVDLPSEYDDAPYRITRRLIEDGRTRLVLRSPLPLPFPVRLLQGSNDTDVPVSVALRLFEHADSPDLTLSLVKGADHRFSEPDNLALLARTLADLPLTP